MCVFTLLKIRVREIVFNSLVDANSELFYELELAIIQMLYLVYICIGER